MIFKRHAKKKEEEVYCKLTKDEFRAIQWLLIGAECLGASRMELHAGSVLDDIKCKKFEEIDWQAEFEQFGKEKREISDRLNAIDDILNHRQRV